MFVNTVNVAQKTEELPINRFNFTLFRLRNYRQEVVFETEELSSNNPEIALDSQVYAGIAEVRGNAVAPNDSDYGLLQATIGQDKGATWNLSIAVSPGKQQLDCMFGLPPTTFALFSRLIPIPVKSVCEAGQELPEEI